MQDSSQVGITNKNNKREADFNMMRAKGILVTGLALSMVFLPAVNSFTVSGGLTAYAAEATQAPSVKKEVSEKLKRKGEIGQNFMISMLLERKIEMKKKDYF